MGLRCVQLQLLKRLGDRVKAGVVERLDGGGSLRQLSLRCDNEVQVIEAHVCIWDPADVVTSHPRPGADVEIHQRPLHGAPTVGVSSYHQQVNLYYYVSGSDGVLIGHEVYTRSG